MLNVLICCWAVELTWGEETNLEGVLICRGVHRDCLITERNGRTRGGELETKWGEYYRAAFGCTSEYIWICPWFFYPPSSTSFQDPTALCSRQRQLPVCCNTGNCWGRCQWGRLQRLLSPPLCCRLRHLQEVRLPLWPSQPHSPPWAFPWFLYSPSHRAEPHSSSSHDAEEDEPLKESRRKEAFLWVAEKTPGLRLPSSANSGPLILPPTANPTTTLLLPCCRSASSVFGALLI